MEQVVKTRSVIRFGDFELDATAGELYRHGNKLKLQEQPLQVLQILLEHPGNVVSRDELQRRIWPSDTFVDFDHGINNAIKRLREVLCDSAESPRFIETIPRRGYRFVGSVGRSPTGRIESLAVLPLENLSRKHGAGRGAGESGYVDQRPQNAVNVRPLQHHR
jgi:DNA-binding winged helix-turn-helix (wHTH) protein